MKLRNQIISLGLVGVLMAGLVGGIGLFNAYRLADAIDDATGMGAALQSSQEADMMHDAIRGDVLLALLGAVNKDAAQLSEAQKGLQEHTDTFNKAMAALQAGQITPQIKTIVGATLPLITQYVEAAKQVQTLAQTDAAAALAASSTFQKVFTELETKMALQADAIEKDAAALNELTKTDVRQSEIQIAAVLVLAVATLLFVALWLARQLARPMADAVHI